MKKRKTKSNRGFTLVEIIAVVAILVVVAGVFSVNMIKSLQKNKETEQTTVTSTITSAADAYVSSNPDKIAALYTGKGYVDISVGELRNQGYVEDTLKDPSTGETISNDRVVRVRYANGAVNFEIIDEGEYAEKEAKSSGYTLNADTLNVKYDSSSNNWCSSNSNKMTGVYSGQSNYMTSVASKLYFTDKNGDLFDHRGIITLTSSSCNVDTTIPGSYRVEYTYTYQNEDGGSVTGYGSRSVNVVPDQEDVVDFKIVSINGGASIRYDSTNGVISGVQVRIKLKTRSGWQSADIYPSVSSLSNYGFTDNGSIVSSSSGAHTATITYTRTNSDGTKPTSRTAEYTVTTNSLPELINGDDQCVGSTCYYKGNANTNYVVYKGKNFRIYYRSGNDIRLIYANNYTTGYYGQGGLCGFGACSNSGYRYYYNLLSYNGISASYRYAVNSSTAGNYGSQYSCHQHEQVNGQWYYKVYPNPTMHDMLDAFASYIGSSSYIRAFATTMHTGALTGGLSSLQRTYSILTYEEYKNIASCSTSYYSASCTSSYASGNYWLADGYSDITNFMVNGNNVTMSSGSTGVRPTLQLTSPVISKGSGTAGDPYYIS